MKAILGCDKFKHQSQMGPVSIQCIPLIVKLRLKCSLIFDTFFILVLQAMTTEMCSVGSEGTKPDF